MTPVVLALILTFCTELTKGQGLTSCVYNETSCGCMTNKGLISLQKYGNEGFKYFDESSSADFSWNPCKDFELIGTTAACIQAFPPVSSFDCGTHDSTSALVKEGVATFQMLSLDGNRQSEFKCTCRGGGDHFKFVTENPEGYYYFELAGSACCPGGGGGGAHDDSSKGLSFGSYLLIAFFSLVFIYVVIGVAVQVGLNNAEGKNRIPNVTFWLAVPGLVKDGIRFTFSWGKRPSYNEM